MSGTELVIRAHHPCAGQSWALSWGSGAESQSWDRRAAWFGCDSNEESLMPSVLALVFFRLCAV